MAAIQTTVVLRAGEGGQEWTLFLSVRSFIIR